MTRIDTNIREARECARLFEQRCATFGSESPQARLQRSLMWKAILAAYRELADEVGDLTAGVLAPDEITAPGGGWAPVIAVSVALRIGERESGQG